MITNKDRSGYFGGSDAGRVVGRWTSNTFKNWFMVKLGFYKYEDYVTKEMRMGNIYEHRILEAFDPSIEQDGQIIIEDLKLRVNYDGIKGNHIYEVKTSKDFKMTPAYKAQAQVEMYALRQTKGDAKLSFLVYPMGEQERANYFTEIERDKITEIPIEYDEDFIEEYLSNLEVLKECLIAGVMPNENDRPNRDKPKGKSKSKKA